ncbi:MAG: SGNH/GDSL hydrolase family protein [Janthinobacterium lividum]
MSEGSSRRGGTLAQYVALGSSFAAGPGLGARDPAGPLVSVRSSHGYPTLLARARNLSLTNMTSSAAKASHLLRHRQYGILRPQIEGLRPETTLVTMTVGGNDVGYVGDLTRVAHRSRPTLVGMALRCCWKGPRPLQSRPFQRLHDELLHILREVSRRSPRAHVLVVTYPVVLPPEGACPEFGIGRSDAALMRAVGERLAAVTRSAAEAGRAEVVDMDLLSVGHDGCAREPWVNRLDRTRAAPFHPTLVGMRATADAIGRVLDASLGVPWVAVTT